MGKNVLNSRIRSVWVTEKYSAAYHSIWHHEWQTPTYSHNDEENKVQRSVWYLGGTDRLCPHVNQIRHGLGRFRSTFKANHEWSYLNQLSTSCRQRLRLEYGSGWLHCYVQASSGDKPLGVALGWVGLFSYSLDVATPKASNQMHSGLHCYHVYVGVHGEWSLPCLELCYSGDWHEDHLVRALFILI